MQRNTDNSSYNCARVKVRTVSWSCSISYVSMSPRVTRWKLFFFWAVAKMLESHGVRCRQQRQEDGRNGERERMQGVSSCSGHRKAPPMAPGSTHMVTWPAGSAGHPGGQKSIGEDRVRARLLFTVKSIGWRFNLWLTAGAWRVCRQVGIHVLTLVMSDSRPPGTSVHGILQARTLEWVAISSSRGSSPPRIKPESHVSCVAGRFFMAASPGKPQTEPCLLFSHSVMSDSLWPHGYRLPGSLVHGIPRARILEWVAISSSKQNLYNANVHTSGASVPMITKSQCSQECFPWKWQLTPIFLPGKYRGQSRLAGYSPWGLKESDTTEHS